MPWEIWSRYNGIWLEWKFLYLNFHWNMFLSVTLIKGSGTGSGNGLVLSGNKPLHKLIASYFAAIYVASHGQIYISLNLTTHPHQWAMGCLLRVICWQMTTLQYHFAPTLRLCGFVAEHAGPVLAWVWRVSIHCCFSVAVAHVTIRCSDDAPTTGSRELFTLVILNWFFGNIGVHLHIQ